MNSELSEERGGDKILKTEKNSYQENPSDFSAKKASKPPPLKKGGAFKFY